MKKTVVTIHFMTDAAIPSDSQILLLEKIKTLLGGYSNVAADQLRILTFEIEAEDEIIMYRELSKDLARKRVKDKETLLGTVADFIIKNQEGSWVAIQKAFKLGYFKTLNLIEQLEDVGVLGERKDDGSRKVLVKNIDDLMP